MLIVEVTSSEVTEELEDQADPMIDDVSDSYIKKARVAAMALLDSGKTQSTLSRIEHHGDTGPCW